MDAIIQQLNETSSAIIIIIGENPNERRLLERFLRIEKIVKMLQAKNRLDFCEAASKIIMNNE